MKISIHPLGPDLHLHRVTIDRDLATRLRTSFQAVVPAAHAFADNFYDRLFAAAPAVRREHRADLAEQKTKLLATLAWVVENLEKGEELKARLRELGRRHEQYGAQPAHYPVVADAMISAMTDVAGAAWDDEIAGDWRTALERVAEIMLGRA
jgi:methyl-accepting chemotaxis protein